MNVSKIYESLFFTVKSYQRRVTLGLTRTLFEIIQIKFIFVYFSESFDFIRSGQFIIVLAELCMIYVKHCANIWENEDKL